MFSTQRASALLSHINFYSEKHGEDAVSGLALKLVLDMPCAVLDLFRPKLTETFFRLDQKDIEVRFPEIEEIRWGRELMGAKVTLGYDDLFESAPIEMNSVVVDHFRFAPKNGGTVTVTLRVKAKPESDDVGRLYEWLAKEVYLSIEPPAAALIIEAVQEHDLVSKAEAEDGDPADPDEPESLRQSDHSPPPVKYRNHMTGETWSGRGRAPKWIEGKDRAPFEVGAAR